MGDVTGHGAEAARLTAMARATFRAVGKLSGDLCTTAARLNEALCAEPRLSLVTIVCLMLRPLEGGRSTKVDVVCCGHPRPIKVSTSTAVEIEAKGPILGWETDATWTQASVSIAAGDCLALYTDGVTDVIGPRVAALVTNASSPA